MKNYKLHKVYVADNHYHLYWFFKNQANELAAIRGSLFSESCEYYVVPKFFDEKLKLKESDTFINMIANYVVSIIEIGDKARFYINFPVKMKRLMVGKIWK